MVEKEISVATADGWMTAFTVHPDAKGPFPVAVVFMDGVGYREQVKENARRFAEGGFFCVAPDLGIVRTNADVRSLKCGDSPDYREEFPSGLGGLATRHQRSLLVHVTAAAQG